MAVTLRQLGEGVLTSIYGRRLGLDDKAQLTGVSGYREASEDVSTTSGSSLSPFGASVLAPVLAGSSGVVPYTLQAMAVGTKKVLALTSTTTGGVTVTVASGHYVTSTGASSGTTVSLFARTAMTLMQVSTTQIVVLGTLGSTATMAST